MNKKFAFITGSEIKILGTVLYRIKALTSFGTVKAGDVGGYLEFENNLSHEGEAWVSDRAMVCRNARVCGNALVGGRAIISDFAQIYGHAQVNGGAVVSGHARVYENATLNGDATVFGNAQIYGDAKVSSSVYGNAKIFGDVDLFKHPRVFGDAEIANRKDIIFFLSVGSTKGTLTVCKTRIGLFISRGCFAGTEEEFLDAVEKTHANNDIGAEYRRLIRFAKATMNDEKIDDDLRYIIESTWLPSTWPLMFSNELFGIRRHVTGESPDIPF